MPRLRPIPTMIGLILLPYPGIYWHYHNHQYPAKPVLYPLEITARSDDPATGLEKNKKWLKPTIGLSYSFPVPREYFEEDTEGARDFASQLAASFFSTWLMRLDVYLLNTWKKNFVTREGTLSGGEFNPGDKVGDGLLIVEAHDTFPDGQDHDWSGPVILSFWDKKILETDPKGFLGGYLSLSTRGRKPPNKFRKTKVMATLTSHLVFDEETSQKLLEAHKNGGDLSRTLKDIESNFTPKEKVMWFLTNYHNQILFGMALRHLRRQYKARQDE